MLFNENVNKKLFISVSLFLVFVLLVLYSINPYHLSAFKFGHYLLNYDLEFLKRGFTGEVFRLLFGDLSYKFFDRFSRVLYIVFSISFLLITIKYLRNSIEKTGSWLFFILFITSSATFQHFYYDIGRFDQFIYIYGLILIYLAHKNINMFYIFAPILILIMLLTHEASLFIFIPFVLVYFVYINSSKKNIIIAIVLLVFTLFSTAIISTKGSMKSLNLEDHTAMLSSKHTQKIDGIHVVHKSVFIENSKMTIKRLISKKVVKEHIKLIAYLFPLFLFFGLFLFNDIKLNSLRFRHFLLLVAFTPLGLYIVAFDFFRWWALAITNFFLALMLISFYEKEFGEKLIEHFHKHQLLVFVIIVNSIVFGAMGVTTAFYRY